ncbi:MAG: hypothetical protein MI806_22390 [Minwuiales bacterium]|nr:hypothetical protein [Minwuiales bacterium]
MSDKHLGAGGVSQNVQLQYGRPEQETAKTGSTLVNGQAVRVTASSKAPAAPLPATDAPANDHNLIQSTIADRKDSGDYFGPLSPQNPRAGDMADTELDDTLRTPSNDDTFPGVSFRDHRQARPSLNGRVTPVVVENVGKVRHKTGIGGAAAGALALGAGGAYYGSIFLATLGTIPFGPLGTLGGAALGAVIGGIGGAIVGAVVGGVGARFGYENRRAERQQKHFDQATASLRNEGVKFSNTEKSNLNKISAAEWNKLLPVSKRQVGDKAQRQKVREAVILKIARGHSVENVLAFKQELLDTGKRNCLDFMADAHFVREMGTAAAPRFLENYGDLISSEEFWSAPDNLDAAYTQPLVQKRVPEVYGGAMLLLAMRRLQSAYYKLTQDDRRQINQGLSPHESGDFISDEVKSHQVGRIMSYEDKAALADKMAERYVNHWNVRQQFRTQFNQAYSAATTLDQKLSILESYHAKAMDGSVRGSFRLSLDEMPKQLDLSALPPATTRPKQPPALEDLQRQDFLNKARAGFSGIVEDGSIGSKMIDAQLAGMLNDPLDQDHGDHAQLSNSFVRDYDRAPISLQEPDGTRTNLKDNIIAKRAGRSDLQDWDPRDALVTFCGGDEDVARNLSHYAHQGCLASMVGIVQSGAGIKQDGAATKERKQAPIGFADASDQAPNFRVKKDAYGDFILTANLDAGVNGINPPRGDAIPIDPVYNRCNFQLKIKLLAQDLKEGNGKYELLEPPSYRARLNPDRGSFENTEQLHVLAPLNRNDILAQERTEGLTNFLDRHWGTMTTDKFWQSRPNSMYGPLAQGHAALIGVSVGLGMLDRITTQGQVNREDVNDFNKVLSPLGALANQSRLPQYFAGRPLDERIKHDIADKLYSQYVERPNGSDGGIGGGVAKLNLSSQAKLGLAKLFDDEDATADQKMAALREAWRQVISSGGDDIARDLQLIYKHWPDPQPSGSVV